MNYRMELDRRRPRALDTERQRGHRIVGDHIGIREERHFVFSTAAMITITAISIAMSIAAAAVQYMQQQQAAEAAARNQAAMSRAQDEAIAQNAALANRAYMEQSKALQERQTQEDRAAVSREIDVTRQGAEARSTALTAAGEAGVSGLSVNALLDDFTRQEADYRFQSRTNLEGVRGQTERELQGAQMTAEGRTNSMKPYQAQPVNYPSLLGAALRVGADATGTVYNNFYKGKPNTPSMGAGNRSSAAGDIFNNGNLT